MKDDKIIIEYEIAATNRSKELNTAFGAFVESINLIHEKFDEQNVEIDCKELDYFMGLAEQQLNGAYKNMIEVLNRKD